MGPVLKCINENKCFGCGLCVLTAAKILTGRFSLGGSCIRVKRRLKGPYLFSVEIDEGVCPPLKEVVNICPARCFAIVEESKIEE